VLRWLSILLALSGAVSAASVNLAWDPVADSRLTGYELAWGSAPGDYSQYQPAADTTATLDLAEPGPWHIAVRAIGDDGGKLIYSGWSNEVLWQATRPLDQFGLWARYEVHTVMATDSFTNSNSTALSTHNDAWVHVVGTDSGRIYNNGVSFGAWATSTYLRDDSTSDESQIVLLSGEPGTAGKVRPAVRVSSGIAGYAIALSATGDNWTTLNLYKNNTWQQHNNAISYAKANNHTLRIVASGTSSPVTITCYVDGNLELTWQDSSSPYTSGNPGIYILGNGGNNYAFGDDWTDNAAAATTGLPRRALDGPFYGALRGSVR
jgi:hypothetical protein